MIPARLGKLLILSGAVWLGCRVAPGMSKADHDITAGDMRARIDFLASDMLRGRDTPSPGLEIAAEYIEAEFRRFGLEPVEGVGYRQTYRLARSEMGDGWSLTFSRGRRRAKLNHRSDFWGLPWAAGAVEGPVRFVGARPPDETGMTGEAGIWIGHLATGWSARDWLLAATAAGASALILVLSEEVETQMRDWIGDGETLYELGDLQPTLPAALISEESLAAALSQLGLESRTVGAGAAGAQALTARLAADLRIETGLAPNVVGILRGRDPQLREQYVLLSAHMDGLGVGVPVGGDSIYNGADDNASGTAAILEMAEAAAALKTKPKRSLIFLTVSGEEKGLLGSTWFVNHPPISLSRIIADLNIDMIGRNWEDTIAVIGRSYTTLGALVDSVAMANPEFGVTVVGDLWPAERFFFRSDHFNFARNGIPAVFFFNGVHEDYHRPSDEADRIKVEKAARVVRLIFEVALALAEAEEVPRWDPRARAAIVGGVR